jgi:hypothetical protein
LSWGPALTCLLLVVALALPAVAESAGFRVGELDLERKRAFDLGVTDYDGDGRLDLYTTNHMFRESLLRARGNGFVDAYESSGLAPNPAIPGIEDLVRKPRIDAPGLYLFMRAGDRRPHIRIATNRLREIPGIEDRRARGRISVIYPKVKVRRASNAKVEVRRVSRTRSVIDFEARGNARIVLRPNHIDLPFKVSIAGPLPVERIFLGSRAVPAAERSFSIALGDRHGIAWGDYNRDGLNDALLTSGGLSGRARSLPRARSDELLLSDGERLVEATGSGIRKGSCRGREAATIDFDRDGILDLFIGCRRGRPRLFRGRGDGSFDEVRRGMRPLGNSGTASRWVDLDNDGRPELLQAGQAYLRVWSVDRRGRARLRQRVETRNSNKNVDAIAPGDFDNDGDLDLFVAGPTGNTLLVNRRGGALRRRNPAAVGLPARTGVAAAWVDYDNDARLDLFTVPDGLFRGVGGRFRRTGKLQSTDTPRFARGTWFDADTDGRRDLALLVERGRGLFPLANLIRNRTSPANHWLEIDLVGSRGNRQAVGARVRLEAGGRKLTQWVGQNDGSRFGQGHYRLYFGLGRLRRAENVTVFWPDGKRTRLGTVRADRLRVVER